nr:zinc knuckle CX2CX4HX4C [Tanacetum cinerariifolium]
MTGKVDALTFGPAGHVRDENGSSMGGDTHVRVLDNTNPKDREYPSIVSVHGNDSGLFGTEVDARTNYVPSSRPDVATSSHFSEAINFDCMRNASNATTNMHKSPNVEEVSEFIDLEILIHNIDDVANLWDDFTTETIRVEYEWKPPRCYLCKIFGHVHDHCPNKVKKRNNKSKSTNGGQFAGHSVKKTLIDEEEDVENVYDESANLFQNTKTSGGLSFTAAVGRFSTPIIDGDVNPNRSIYNVGNKMHKAFSLP